jgi:hypothetical protein
MILTQEDFQEWKANQVTKALFIVLNKEREYLKERLCLTSMDNEDDIRGRCGAIKALLEIEYEDIVEGLRNE